MRNADTVESCIAFDLAAETESYQRLAAACAIHADMYALDLAGGGLCWHHVDLRDVVDAFVRAIRSGYDGYRAFYIAAPSTLPPKPTLERIHDFFGGLPSDVDESWFHDNPFAPMFDTRNDSKHLGWHAGNNRRGEVCEEVSFFE